MNYLKIKKLNNELEDLPTITQKLDFYKENYFDKYTGVLLHDYFETKSAKELGSEYSDGFEGDIKIPNMWQKKYLFDPFA